MGIVQLLDSAGFDAGSSVLSDTTAICSSDLGRGPLIHSLTANDLSPSELELCAIEDKYLEKATLMFTSYGGVVYTLDYSRPNRAKLVGGKIDHFFYVFRKIYDATGIRDVQLFFMISLREELSAKTIVGHAHGLKREFGNVQIPSVYYVGINDYALERTNLPSEKLLIHSFTETLQQD